mmetsp:Transcript_35026/g.99283  ORF Transcript_35026/g.99283 Transcript_35026/m.99283 type:complete len:410 (-) Transcript_35026:153-1382(-)|eukprot:CAMPEP_0117674762 /NCGR_PEP_ID=MMETSP0804-20121206/15219_1 /TAXON_ID=1074897 /ORGANISM="Tetraselmis astigmatica, Strain CCMP880" /LENGTH=409 /DNA_ID=CAMNT_0005483669 /DNA_START=575 /DNA_END=1804 /DNA_ORIENTATION=+
MIGIRANGASRMAVHTLCRRWRGAVPLHWRAPQPPGGRRFSVDPANQPPLGSCQAAVGSELDSFWDAEDMLSAQPLPKPGHIHPALQLIADRAHSDSLPGNRSDPYKLGLVVEGGGMRGAVSAGMLVALHDMGLPRVFDAVYGSSAGAINLTYFLSGQREGVNIYADFLSNKDFIDLSRLWKRNSWVLDLDFLLEKIMQEVVPLDWGAVLNNEIPLKAVASCLNTLQPVMLDNFEDEHDLLTCLRASANVPGIAGAPVAHRGHSLVDAAVFEPIPFPMALRDRCTHVLVLCSRPDPQRMIRNPIMAPFKRAAVTLVRKAVLSPPYMKPAWTTRFAQENLRGMSVDDILFKSMDEGSLEAPGWGTGHVYPVYPGPAAAFAPLCVDPETINAGVEEGAQAVRKIMGPLLCS